MTRDIGLAALFVATVATAGCTPAEEEPTFSCTGPFCDQPSNNNPADTGGDTDNPDADPADTVPDSDEGDTPADGGDTRADAPDTPEVPDDTADVPDDAADAPDDTPDAPDDTPDVPADVPDMPDDGDADTDVPDVPDVPDDPRCESDLDCPGLRTCNIDTGECEEAPVCTNADDCGPGRFCRDGDCADEPPECIDDGPQCPGRAVCRGGQCEAVNCITDLDCVQGRRCDQDSFLCVECFADDDCPGIQVCNFGFCFENFGEDCGADIDCEGRRTCDDDLRQCVNPECAPDEFEPNESYADARRLPAGQHALTACDQDVDYFKFNTRVGDGFLVLVEFDPLEFALQGAIYRPNGDILVDVFDQNRIGQLVLPVEHADQAGDWAVSVFFSDGTTGPYELSYIPVQGGFCRNDNYEPNDVAEQAGRAQVGQFATLRLCEEDADWYRIALSAGTQYEWLVLTQEGDAPGIEVYRPDGVTRVLRDTTPNREKTLAFEAAETGDYLVRVFHTGDGEPSEYFIGFSERRD